MQLSAEETTAFLQLAMSAERVTTESEFDRWVQTFVPTILPHRSLYVAKNRLTLGRIEVDHVIGVNLAADHPTTSPRMARLQDRPFAVRGLKQRAPYVLDPEAPEAQTLQELHEMKHLEFGRMGIHLLPECCGAETYFCFGHIPTTVSEAVAVERMRLVCPVLHTALTSLLIRTRESKCAIKTKLTKIERELLYWLAAGRTNEEIARLRNRSLSTIRNQLQLMYEKLGVRSRAEAVAQLLKFGPVWPSPDDLDRCAQVVPA